MNILIKTNGKPVEAELNKRSSICKGCGQVIFFAKAPSGKFIPVQKIDDQWESHFAHCSKANNFRKKYD